MQTSHENLSADEFLNSLGDDLTLPTYEGDKNRPLKIFMYAPPNQGTVAWIPMMCPVLKRFYLEFKVLEFRGENNDGEATTYRILDNVEHYGKLTEEEMQVYQEVKSLFKKLYDDEWYDQGVLKYRTNLMFPGHLVMHTNKANQEVKEQDGSTHKERPAYIIFTGGKVGGTLKTATDNERILKANSGQDQSWALSLFSPQLTQRRRFLSCKYYLGEGGEVGYQSTFSIVTSNADNPILGVEGRDISPEHAAMFEEGMLANFIGWQKGKDGLFNLDNMKWIRTQFLTYMHGSDTSVEQPKPQNNNQAPDPMMNGSTVSPEASIPAPSVAAPGNPPPPPQPPV